MAHCREYWDLAERSDGLFQLVHQADSFVSANLDRDSESTRLLHGWYMAVIKRLDEHTITCPRCDADDPRRNELE
jgi:hypothetical protein